MASEVDTEAQVRYFVRIEVDGQDKPHYYSMYADEVDRVVQEYLKGDKVYLYDPDRDAGGLYTVNRVKYVLINEHDEQVP
jgi:hypothetical protein